MSDKNKIIEKKFCKECKCEQEVVQQGSQNLCASCGQPFEPKRKVCIGRSRGW